MSESQRCLRKLSRRNFACMNQIGGSLQLPTSLPEHGWAPPVDVDDAVYVRAVEVVLADLKRIQLLSSRVIVVAVRSSRSVLERELCERQSVQLLRTVVTPCRQPA
jgi:hypothetical protein